MKQIMQGFVVALVGVILTPVIYAVATEANVTGITLTVLLLVPTIFVISVLFAVVAPLLKMA